MKLLKRARFHSVLCAAVFVCGAVALAPGASAAVSPEPHSSVDFSYNGKLLSLDGIKSLNAEGKAKYTLVNVGTREVSVFDTPEEVDAAAGFAMVPPGEAVCRLSVRRDWGHEPKQHCGMSVHYVRRLHVLELQLW